VKSIPVLAVILAAAPCFAGVISPVPSGGSYQVYAPQVAADLRMQLTALDLAGAPSLMAGALNGILTAPGVTPTQLAAARLIVEAVEHPAAAIAVQRVVRALPGAAVKSAEDLGRVASRVRQDPAATAAFKAVREKLPDLERANGIAWPGAGDLKERLDAFFTGSVKTGATDLEAVDGTGPGKIFTPLRKPQDPMKEAYQVIVGGEPQAATLSLSELVEALDGEDVSVLKRFLPESNRPQDRLIRLQNKAGRVTVTLVSGESDHLLWADFFETDRHPLLEKLARKFTFAAFQHHARNGEVDYEAPHIDADNMQLTTYGLRLSKDNAVLTDETMHVYVGKRLLVTTHRKERASVSKAQRLLAETGRHKPPTEMMVFILGDTINRYSAVIDSLSKDFSAIAEKVGRKDSDDSILQDAVSAGKKIDLIHETVLRQRQVLKDLLSINEFHRSEFVPVAELEKHLQSLDHHLTVLDHYQERKNGLIELYRAKVSNELDEAMKRLAAISALIAPAAIIGSLMGMNVLLPGANLPHVFWGVMALITVVTTGLFVAFKRNGWL
jgi:Mg2+ and Co2+ transporter CorA